MLEQPSVSLRKLAGLRGRERILDLLRGSGHWLAIVLLLLAVACVIDWRVDRLRDTPRSLRVGLTAFQAVAAIGLGLWLIVRPMFRRRSDDELAARVENGLPEFGHRLVTSIQLSRPDADTRGMSPGLISDLTRETDAMSADRDFTSLANTKGVPLAFGLPGLPLALFAGMVVVLGAGTVVALLQRQLLMDAEIPHSVSLVNATPELWPAGDEVLVEYKITGRTDEDDEGILYVTPEDQPREEYPLKFVSRIDSDTALFSATIPPATIGFRHSARILDGRTRASSEVRYESRPAVAEAVVVVRQPPYLGLRPDGKPYEEPQAQGEVRGMVGAPVHVRIAATKPLSRAKLVLIGRGVGTTLPADLSETVRDNLDGDTVEFDFNLAENQSGWRVELRDRNGFDGATPFRRGISILPDTLPEVRFLPERMPAMGRMATESSDIEGHPALLNGPVPMAWTASSPLGLWQANLVYRFNTLGPWLRLPLFEVPETDESGPFELKLGRFRNSGDYAQTPFHAMFSDAPLVRPNRLQGGGRFDFQTKGLQKTDPASGEKSNLNYGDAVEYYIEVFDRLAEYEFAKTNRRDRKPGVCEPRRKEFVSARDMRKWIDEVLKSEENIRGLEKKQKGVFTPETDRE